MYTSYYEGCFAFEFWQYRISPYTPCMSPPKICAVYCGWHVLFSVTGDVEVWNQHTLRTLVEEF